jgi:hypothetical protein
MGKAHARYAGRPVLVLRLAGVVAGTRIKSVDTLRKGGGPTAIALEAKGAFRE